MRLFCFGLGFTALSLARRLLAEGWSVAGTCRGEAKCAALRARGIEAHFFDGVRPLADPSSALAGTTHVLDSVPPDRGGGSTAPVLSAHGPDIAASAPRWVGYLSTTGVYGDRRGGRVDETAPLRPDTARGERRLEAERRYISLLHDRGLPVHVFRLSGIYGPGRSALGQMRAGTARRIHKPGQVFNRIHVEDAAAAIAASMVRPMAGEAFNLADDEPCPAHEVVRFAAELLGMPPPPMEPFETAELSPMARSFYADNKIVDNAKVKRELGLSLAFPTFREGLRAEFEATRSAS